VISPSFTSDHVVTAPDGHRSSTLLPTKVARKGVSVGGSRNISKLHQLNSYFRNPAVRISKAHCPHLISSSSHLHVLLTSTSNQPQTISSSESDRVCRLINPKLITPPRSYCKLRLHWSEDHISPTRLSRHRFAALSMNDNHFKSRPDETHR